MENGCIFASAFRNKHGFRKQAEVQKHTDWDLDFQDDFQKKKSRKNKFQKKLQKSFAVKKKVLLLHPLWETNNVSKREKKTEKIINILRQTKLK